ncbi:MAG: DUF2924 domain-containing protein [Planctomycetes bacterium]|nr:DUF2924 domain-containing protein [Planctomycetota bacterium]
MQRCKDARTRRHPRGEGRRIPPPGAALARPFKGQVYEVTVLPNRFEYDGETYRSSGAVAHALTRTGHCGDRCRADR